MASPVLDSFAVLAFLFKERGYQKVLRAFEAAADRDEPALIAAPNWAEVRYIVERKVGAEQWEILRSTILALPLQVIPVDQTLAESAGAMKATKKMSLADCFAAALAKQRQVEVYTGDPEFTAVKDEVAVVWLS